MVKEKRDKERAKIRNRGEEILRQIRKKIRKEEEEEKSKSKAKQGLIR